MHQKWTYFFIFAQSLLTRIDEKLFKNLKDEQGMNCKFEEFSEFFLKILNKAKEHSKLYEIQMIMENEYEGYLEVSTRNELRNFVIILLPFRSIKKAKLKASAAYKYNVLKAKTELLENRFIEIVNALKRTNPNLLLK